MVENGVVPLAPAYLMNCRFSLVALTPVLLWSLGVICLWRNVRSLLFKKKYMHTRTHIYTYFSFSLKCFMVTICMTLCLDYLVCLCRCGCARTIRQLCQGKGKRDVRILVPEVYMGLWSGAVSVYRELFGPWHRQYCFLKWLMKLNGWIETQRYSQSTVHC